MVMDRFFCDDTLSFFPLNIPFCICHVYMVLTHMMKSPEKGMGCMMLFIAMAKFKQNLSEEIVAQNMLDIETDTEGGVRYHKIYWTLGKYDTVVIFEAPNEKVAMDVVFRRLDRMDVETLVALPADPEHPAGPA